MSEREREARANELRYNAAKECEKLSRYAELAAKLLKDAHVFTVSEDYYAAQQLALTAANLAERVAERAKVAAAWLHEARALKNELGAAESPAPARPETKRPPAVGIEL